VILRRVTLIGPARVGAGSACVVQVTLEKQIESRLEAFQAAVRDFPEVMECYLMTGDSDYLLRVVVPDVDSFQKFLSTAVEDARRRQYPLQLRAETGQIQDGVAARTACGRRTEPGRTARPPAIG